MGNFYNERLMTNTTSTVYNYNYLMSFACEYGHKDCIDSAKKEFEKFKAGNYS